jgi:hypothetical protein
MKAWKRASLCTCWNLGFRRLFNRNLLALRMLFKLEKCRNSSVLRSNWIMVQHVHRRFHKGFCCRLLHRPIFLWHKISQHKYPIVKNHEKLMDEDQQIIYLINSIKYFYLFLSLIFRQCLKNMDSNWLKVREICGINHLNIMKTFKKTFLI